MVVLFHRRKSRLVWFAGFVLFEILMFTGYMASITHASVRSGQRGFTVFAAFAYSFLLTSSVAVAAYTGFEAIRNHLDAAIARHELVKCTLSTPPPASPAVAP